ncbi:MAG: dephospho-CoA kinase [Phycisphaeraceae bacterium]|nr:dephospho-CoA kinase [Phycisphaeraceae bacterium]
MGQTNQGPSRKASPPAPRKPVIGLTGGIGSGKTLVAGQLATLGCAVINADDLARQALEKAPVRQELVRWWGPAVLDGQGRVNRQEVARIVFADAAALARLEGLLHPKVALAREQLRHKHQNDPQVLAIVEDCPLLFEKGLDSACDVIIFVDAPRAIRLARVTSSRGWDEAELARREKSQIQLDKKAALADYVIDNSTGVDECLSHTRHVLSHILQKQAAR